MADQNPFSVAQGLLTGAVNTFGDTARSLADEHRLEQRNQLDRARRERDTFLEDLRLVLASQDLNQEDRALLNRELQDLQSADTVESIQGFFNQPRRVPIGGAVAAGDLQTIMQGGRQANVRTILGEVQGRVAGFEDERIRMEGREEQTRQFVLDFLTPLIGDDTVPTETKQRALINFINSGGRGFLADEEFAALVAGAGFIDENDFRAKAANADLIGAQVGLTDAQRESIAAETAERLAGRADRLRILSASASEAESQAQIASVNAVIVGETRDAVIRSAFAEAKAGEAEAITAEAVRDITVDDIHRQREQFIRDGVTQGIQDNVLGAQIEAIRASTAQVAQEMEQSGERFESEVDALYLAEIQAALETGIDAGLSDEQKVVLARLMNTTYPSQQYTARLATKFTTYEQALEAQKTAEVLENQATRAGIDQTEVRTSILQSDAQFTEWRQDREMAAAVLLDASETRQVLFQSATQGDTGLFDLYEMYLSDPVQFEQEASQLKARGITLEYLADTRADAEFWRGEIRDNSTLQRNVLEGQLAAASAATLGERIRIYEGMAGLFTTVEQMEALPSDILDELGDLGQNVIRSRITRRDLLEAETQSLDTIERLLDAGVKGDPSQWLQDMITNLGSLGIDENTAEIIAQGYMNNLHQEDKVFQLGLTNARTEMELLRAQTRDLNAQAALNEWKLLNPGSDDSEFYQLLLDAADNLGDTLDDQREAITARQVAGGCIVIQTLDPAQAASQQLGISAGDNAGTEACDDLLDELNALDVIVGAQNELHNEFLQRFGFRARLGSALPDAADPGSGFGIDFNEINPVTGTNFPWTPIDGTTRDALAGTLIQHLQGDLQPPLSDLEATEAWRTLLGSPGDNNPLSFGGDREAALAYLEMIEGSMQPAINEPIDEELAPLEGLVPDVVNPLLESRTGPAPVVTPEDFDTIPPAEPPLEPEGGTGFIPAVEGVLDAAAGAVSDTSTTLAEGAGNIAGNIPGTLASASETLATGAATLANEAPGALAGGIVAATNAVTGAVPNTRAVASALNSGTGAVVGALSGANLTEENLAQASRALDVPVDTVIRGANTLPTPQAAATAVLRAIRDGTGALVDAINALPGNIRRFAGGGGGFEAVQRLFTGPRGGR